MSHTSNAFHRATKMVALIAAAMDLANIGDRTAALTSIGPYESRGKSGKRARGRTGIAATRRASVKARNVKRNRAAHRNRAN